MRNMKKTNESLSKDLNNQIKQEIMSIPSFDVNPIEAMKDINAYNKELGEESEETKEATSAGAAGQFSQPLFDDTKKVEATEATSTASAGQYSTPAFVAKNSKNWRGGKKPIFPGGKFVKVKEKCKKFPYCNQGDIKALKLSESSIDGIIKKLANKYNLTESVIKSLIKNKFKQSGNNLNQ